jgi:tetratricopeptide (TPR) repeat protein
MRHLTLFLLLLLPLAAQSVRWEPAGGSLALNRSTELQLVFDGCEPTDEPNVPAVDGLLLDRSGQMSSTNIVNGRVNQLEILGFTARPTVEKTLVLPAFRVKTNKGELTVPSVTFTVGQAAAAGGTIPLDSVARSQFTLPSEVYAGEVFPIEYRLTALRRYLHQAASDLTWDPAPLVLEDWPQLTAENLLSSGEKQIVLKKASRALVRTPGTLALKPGNQLVNIVTGSSAFGFFNSPNLEQFAITTPQATLHVKPLPSGAPASFNGAVGQFEVKSRVVPEKAQVGDPVTWTLTVSGTGNWPDLSGIPAREVSTLFRAVQAQPKRTVNPGSLFDAALEEDVVLVPTAPGTYSFGPYEWSYFDPTTGQYRIARTAAHRVVIAPASPTTGGGTGTSSPGAGSLGSDASVSAPQVPAPGLPAPVLGGAYDTTLHARAPLATSPWLLRVALPLALFPFTWALLACARARLLDPKRPARAARLHALALTSQLSTTRAAPAALPLIAEWQDAVARTLELAGGYPKPGVMEAYPEVKSVWCEAEAMRFGRRTELPEDWSSRARAALLALPPASFDWRVLGRTRSWWPAAVVLMAWVSLATTAVAQSASAAEGYAAYQRGDFLKAEASWRTALDQAPLDAGLHLNLSLALSQQNQWHEATAHALLAFLQAPAEPRTLRQMRFCLQQPTYTPQGVEPLIDDSFLASNVRRLTPRGWQSATACLLGSVMLCLVAGIAVRFGWLPRWLKPVLFATAFVALAGAAGAVYSFFHYGQFRDPNVVLVWRENALYSVPTAADSQQQKSKVEPGTVAIAERTFLSWTQLRFANGETAWVQTSGLIAIWK